MTPTDPTVPPRTAASGTSAPSRRHEIGILAEDLQGALTAASRLQQRGVSVQVVRSIHQPLDGAQAIVVDLNAAQAGEVYRQARMWAAWLRDRGCERLELRIDTLLRGTPVDCITGLVEGSGLVNPVVAVMAGYPSAGRVCIDGEMVVPSPVSGDVSYSVADSLFPGEEVGVVSVDTLTEGAGAVDARIAGFLAAGIRRLVFDSTTEGHLAVAGAAIGQLERTKPVLTVTSGAWLRYHPALDSDGFIVLVATGTNELDRAQLARIADVYGQAALTTTAPVVLDATDTQLRQLIGRHRLIALHSPDSIDADPAGVAADLARATRRIYDISLQSKNPGLGVVCSGGVTTGAVIRALEPDDLRAGNELEPLCPVVRLSGGPFPNLAVISKASGIGTTETLVRLVRRVIGT
jgi:uncharacterized protein YgbK (DUF1537 family)